MAELTEGCIKPAKGPIGPSADKAIPATGMEQSQEVMKMLARVGKEAQVEVRFLDPYQAMAMVNDI